MLPSENIRHRLPQIRREQDVSQERLAELMNDHGWTWVRSTVAKIESGGRQVSIDELISLAVVLGVPPAALLVPTVRDDIDVTPTTRASSEDVWRWMTGDLVPTFAFGVIPEAELEQRLDEVLTLQRRFLEACPDFVINAERKLPGLRDLASYVAQVQYLAGSAANARKAQHKKTREQIADLLHRIDFRINHLNALHEEED